MLSISSRALQNFFRGANQLKPFLIARQRQDRRSILTPKDFKLLSIDAAAAASRSARGRSHRRQDDQNEVDFVPRPNRNNKNNNNNNNNINDTAPRRGSWEFERSMIRKRAAKYRQMRERQYQFKKATTDASFDDFVNKRQEEDERDDEGEHQLEEEEAENGDVLGSSSSSSAAPPLASRDPSQFTADQNQLAFDLFLQRAIVQHARPSVDALRTSALLAVLRRADDDFTPERFGSPELLQLLRSSRFLKSHRGKWAFVRQFDVERDGVTVKLEAYRYREAPEQDLGTRSLPVVMNSRFPDAPKLKPFT